MLARADVLIMVLPVSIEISRQKMPSVAVVDSTAMFSIARASYADLQCHLYNNL